MTENTRWDHILQRSERHLVSRNNRQERRARRCLGGSGARLGGARSCELSCVSVWPRLARRYGYGAST